MKSIFWKKVLLYVFITVLAVIIGRFIRDIPILFVICNMMVLLFGPEIIRSNSISGTEKKCMGLISIIAVQLLVIWKFVEGFEYLKISCMFSGIVSIYAVYWFMSNKKTKSES